MDKASKRFWISWYGGCAGDCRPTTVPTPFQWWCTGEDGFGETFTICAVVDAEDESKAWATVRAFWPEARERFIHERLPDWLPDAGRFPRKDGRAS